MNNVSKYIFAHDGLCMPYNSINVMQTNAGFFMDFHAHRHYHINHIFSGSLNIELGGQTYIVRSGCTFVLPPHIPHKLFSQEGYLQTGINLVPCEDSRGMAREFERALYEYSKNGLAVFFHKVSLLPQRLEEYIGLSTQFGLLCAQNCADEMLLSACECMRSGNDTFRNAFLAMCEAFEPWTLSLGEMCRILCISRTQLERMAHRTFGCGAAEYCARLRYKKLCELLEGDETLEAIAVSMGFYDAGHLSRFFSLRSGMTPGEYRRKGFFVN